MAIFEALVARGEEANGLLSALFQFIESHEQEPLEIVSICTEPQGDLQRTTVIFSEERGAAEFHKFLWRARYRYRGQGSVGLGG